MQDLYHQPYRKAKPPSPRPLAADRAGAAEGAGARVLLRTTFHISRFLAWGLGFRVGGVAF